MQDPIRDNSIPTVNRPTPFAALGLVLLAGVGLWLSSVAEYALNIESAALSGAIYYLPFIALPLFLYSRRRGGLSEAMRIKPLAPLPAVSVVLLGLLSVYVASALSAAWGAGLDALGLSAPANAPQPQTEREVALSILTLAAVPAVCEELLFRGLVLSAWETRGTWFAVAVASALFALLHGNLYGLPAYLLVGAVCGYVTFALDSVYAGIACHTVYNAACLILPWLLRGSGAADAPVAVDAAFIFTLVLETATLASLMLLLMAVLRLRARREGIQPLPRKKIPLTRGEKWMLAACLVELLASLVLVTALYATGGRMAG